MKETMRDAARTMACVAPLVAAFAFNSWLNGDADRARFVESERHSAAMLAEAERHNAEMHANSMKDRAVIHEIQKDIQGRLSVLERRAGRESATGDDN